MQCFLFIAALICAPFAVLAQQPGDVVVVTTRPGVTMTLENGRATTVAKGVQFVVDKVDGPRLYVAGSPRGWIDRSKVDSLDEAIEHFTQSLEKTPDIWDHITRGLLWQIKGDYDQAIDDYNAAIALDPDFAPPYANRAIVWHHKGDPDKVLADLSEAIRLEPEFGHCYRLRAQTWRDLGELDKALADLNESIRLNPKETASYFNRAYTWHLKGNDKKARGDLNRAVELTPDSSLAHYQRGRALLVMGRYDEAIVSLREAVRLDPENWSAHCSLAWMLATCPTAEFRDGAKAIKHATKACELTNWAVADRIDTLAAAYAEAGDFPAAVKYQKKALALSNNNHKADQQARLELYETNSPYRDTREDEAPRTSTRDK